MARCMLAWAAGVGGIGRAMGRAHPTATARLRKAGVARPPPLCQSMELADGPSRG